MAGTFSRIITGMKNFIGSTVIEEPADNNDFGQFRNLFINNFAAWSNSFDAGRAYHFYDNSRPLASTVDRISDAFSEISPAIFDRETNDWITAESDAPEADVLRLMANPGFGQTWRQFSGDLAVSYLLTRDAFFIMHGNINRGPLALAVAKPFNVDEVEAADGYVKEYRFSRTTGRAQQATFERIKPSDFRFVRGNFLEMYHILGKTRDDGLRGRSPISALFWDLLQNIQGGQHNASLLKNGMRPEGGFVTEQALTDKQFGRLKEQMQDQHQGALNSGRPLLLDGGLKYDSFTMTNKEMDYAALMVMSADAIADRYKVPLAIINKGAQTLDNYRSSVLALFDDAIEPLTKVIYEGIEKATFPRFGIDANRFDLKADPKSMRVAQIRQAEKMERMAKTNAFTQNEIRSVDGFEAIEGGDTLYVPSSSVPVGEDAFVTNPDEQRKAYQDILELGGLSKRAAQKIANDKYKSSN